MAYTAVPLLQGLLLEFAFSDTARSAPYHLGFRDYVPCYAGAGAYAPEIGYRTGYTGAGRYRAGKTASTIAPTVERGTSAKTSLKSRG